MLLPPSCALAQALLLDAKWQTVFRTPDEIILVRELQRLLVFRLSPW